MADAILANFRTGKEQKYITAEMSFNPTTFQTDPTGCLAYTSDSDFQTPVLNEGTTLQKANQEGDWAFDATTGENKFGMFYCTFNADGVRHEKLNPYNLAQYIATWDGNKWVAGTGSSSITTENTMLMIPTLYWKGTANKLTISNNPAKGTPYAHTIDGMVYPYLAIGVYQGKEVSGVLKSISGVQATAEKTRADFRGCAQANLVSGGKAMLWNYYQWSLMKYLAYFSLKSFQGQGLLGQGGNPYNTGITGGCDALGPYAGDVVGMTSSEKCLIEDFWGYKYQFVDDVLVGKNDGKIYVGQNASPDDTIVSDKTAITWSNSGGFPTVVLTGDKDWGLGTDTAGDKSKGLCDYQLRTNTSTSAYRLLYVGGDSYDASTGIAGPGGVYSNTLTNSNGHNGSRLSFVLEEE